MDPILLRRATLEDAKILLDWRNDSATRQNSLCHAPVVWEKHLQWLQKCLDDPNRALYIAETDGIAVGTVRADFDGKIHELSWTVAPNQRGKGVGLQLVQSLIATLPFGSQYQAVVLTQNEASHRIALALGMQIANDFGSHVLYCGRREAL